MAEQTGGGRVGMVWQNRQGVAEKAGVTEKVEVTEQAAGGRVGRGWQNKQAEQTGAGRAERGRESR